jgi:hypothetical protein
MLEQMIKSVKGVNFGDISFTVLSAKSEYKNKDERIFFDMFRELQKESLEISTKSKLISVDSGHFIQIEKPEVVIEVIREMVEEN